MLRFLDRYEIKAHLLPSLIIVLPPFLAVHGLQIERGLGLVQFMVLLPLLYGLAILLRQRGRRLQRELWKQLDGPPSTRYLRWRDRTLSHAYKMQLHHAIQRLTGVRMPSESEEIEDPQGADKKYEDAFDQLRLAIRRNDPDGPAAMHNADYGFARNLLAGIWIWRLSVSVAIAVVIWRMCRFGYSAETLSLFVLTTVSFLSSIITSGYLKEALYDNADHYVRSVFEWAISIASQEKPQTKDRRRRRAENGSKSNNLGRPAW